MIFPLAIAGISIAVSGFAGMPMVTAPPPQPHASVGVETFYRPPVRPHVITRPAAPRPSERRSAPHKAKPAPKPVQHHKAKPAHKSHPRRAVTVSLPTGAMMNTDRIYNGLRSMGLSPNAAAGVEGNIYQESHGNSYTPSPVGGGLFGLLVENGGSTTGGSVRVELGRLHNYIEQNGSVRDINAHAGNAKLAADHFCNNYERPGIPMLYNREIAAVYFAQITNGR